MQTASLEHSLDSPPLTRDLQAFGGAIDFDALKPLHEEANSKTVAAAAAVPQKPAPAARLTSAPRAAAAKVEFDYDYSAAAAVAPSPNDLSEYAVPDVEVISTSGGGLRPAEPVDEDLAFLRWLQPQYRCDPAHLQLHKLIGRGAFGVVYSGTYRGQDVAVKLVKRSRPSGKAEPRFSSARSGDTTVPASASSSLSAASLVSFSSSSAGSSSDAPYAFSCSIADSALLQSLPAHIQPLQQLVQEILVLHYLCTENDAQPQATQARSEHILHFLGAAYSADALMMLSRLYPLGSVESCLLARPPPLVPAGARSRVPKPLPPAALAAPFDACLPLRLRMVLQVAQALRFCHERHVIHHDVAARNILLDAQWQCALADFGLANYDTALSSLGSAVIVNQKQQQRPVATTMQRAASEPLQERDASGDTPPPATSTSLSLPASLSALPRSTPVCELVSVRHAAPESIRGSTSKPGSASPSSSVANSASLDCWSFAVTAWEVLAGRQPFESLKNFQVAFSVVEEGARLPLDANAWPQELCGLMQACWATEPAQRPNMQAAVSCLERCIAALPQPVSFTLPVRRTAPSPNKLQASPPHPSPNAEDKRGGGGSGAAASRPVAAPASSSSEAHDALFPQHYTQTDPSIVRDVERAPYQPVPQQQQQQQQQPQAQSSYSPVPSFDQAAPGAPASSSYSAVAPLEPQSNESLNALAFAPAPALAPAPAAPSFSTPAPPPPPPAAVFGALAFGGAPPQGPPPPAGLAPPPPPPPPAALGAAGPATGAAAGAGAGAGALRRRSAAIVPPVADLLSTKALLSKTPSAGLPPPQSRGAAGFAPSKAASPLMMKKSSSVTKPVAAPVSKPSAPASSAPLARRKSMTTKNEKSAEETETERKPVAEAAAAARPKDEAEEGQDGDNDDEDDADASSVARKGGAARSSSSSSRGGRGGGARAGSRAQDVSVLSKQSRGSRASSVSSSSSSTLSSSSSAAAAASTEGLPAPKSAGFLSRLGSLFGIKKGKPTQPQRETQQAQVADAPDGAAVGGAAGSAAAARPTQTRDAGAASPTAGDGKMSKKRVVSARPMSSTSAASAAGPSKSKVAAATASPAPPSAKSAMFAKKKTKALSISSADRSASFSESASSASSSPTATATTSALAAAAAAAPAKDQDKESPKKADKDTRKESAEEEAVARAPAARVPAAAPAPAPAPAAAPSAVVSRAPSLMQSRLSSMASVGAEDDEGFFDDEALPMMLQSNAVLTPAASPAGDAAPEAAAELLEDEEDEAQAAPSVEVAPGGAYVRQEIEDLPQAQHMLQQESPFAFASTLREQITEAKQQQQQASSAPRMIQFSELRSVNQINAEVLEASLPAASGSAETVSVVGRVIDVDLFESLRALLSDPSASAMLMPVEALVEPAANTPGQAGVVLVRRSVLEDADGSPLTLHASLQSARGLGACFSDAGSSLRPLLVALLDYVRAVQWLLQHDAPTMVGGLRQIPFLPSSLSAPSSSSSAPSESPSRVQLPASSLLLLHRSLQPHLFDSASSPALLEARSQELQSARYLAPESVRTGEVGTQAAEVWAVGCTLWEAVQQGRFRAYEDTHPDASINQLLLGVATGSMSLSRPKISEQGEGAQRQQQMEELVRIMEACTQREPAARPSLDDVMQRLQAMIV